MSALPCWHHSRITSGLPIALPILLISPRSHACAASLYRNIGLSDLLAPVASSL
jgi:hypothetical protein